MKVQPLIQRDRQTISLTAMVKDETVCIRCGLCAKRCPVDCITLETFLFDDSPVLMSEENEL